MPESDGSETESLPSDAGADVNADLDPSKVQAKKLAISSARLEQVEWTDDSDDTPQNISLKRKADAKGKGKRCRRKKQKKDGANETPEDKTAFAGMPDYLAERRLEFDRNRKRSTAAGLCFPPDYSGIEFSDDERLAELEERPRFDPGNSGVKPCRPHENIQLVGSLGVIPASIAQYLRDYQVAGVDFLHRLFVRQRGGVLGDDMGLGKTVQVAAFLAVAFGKTGDERDAKRMRKIRRAAGRRRWYPTVLIVCPGSLIVNWRNELTRWGWWSVEIFHGARKDDVLQTARAGRLEIVITTYDTYKNCREAINTVQWDAVVADECHRMKDRSAETTRAMDAVNALCRIGLTGTAIQNRYEELWTLLNWTNPGRFGTAAEWNRAVSTPLKVGQSHDATLAQLRLARQTARKLVDNLLPDVFLRRIKALIAHQLPRKTDRAVFCPLTDLQRAAYEAFLDSDDMRLIRTASLPCDCGSGRKRGWCCHSRVSDGRPWMHVVFPSMLVLQRLANHVTLLVPAATDSNERQRTGLQHLRTCFPDDWENLHAERDHMIRLANPEYCGKWKILRRLLRFWRDSGDKVLIFSHSVRLLRTLQYLFNRTSYNVSFLDGSLNYEERQRVVDDFNANPAQFVFLVSIKAGGVGLNITSANKVVIFDPHWNPSYDLQAQDRAYRIGQTRDVDVFRLVSVGTIEEIVYARQIYKQQQANIGYTASSERRYFRGVQEDSQRKGEIFGLDNLFTFHGERPVLRDIVNKTNVAEARAGVHLVDLDSDGGDDGGGGGGAPHMRQISSGQDDEDNNNINDNHTDGHDDDDEGGLSQLAALVAAENQQELRDKRRASRPPRSDAVQAILTSAGVEYTHENSEVVGSSRVEEQISRRAEGRAATAADDDDWDKVATTAATASVTQDTRGIGTHGGTKLGTPLLPSPPPLPRYTYNPPNDVLRRQFCTMAREFGFSNATDFALVVESWTQEQRRNCLEKFYRMREEKLMGSRWGASESKERLGQRQRQRQRQRQPNEVNVEKTSDAKVSVVPDARGVEIWISDDDHDDEL